MSIRNFVCLLLATLLPVSASAEDAAGKWSAVVQSPQGELTMTFNFNVEGNVLTGSMSNDFMGENAISDGTINGNDLSFKVSIQGGPGGAITISYTGNIEGDQMNLTRRFEGGGPGGPGGAPAEATLTASRVQ